LDFALCEPKRLLKVEKCLKENAGSDEKKDKRNKVKLAVKLNDLRDFERRMKEQVDSVNLLVSEDLFYLESEICQVQRDAEEYKRNVEALASACEDNEFKLNETLAEMTKLMENCKNLEEIFDKHQIAFHGLKDFVSEINSGLQMRILLGADKTWVQELLENYVQKDSLDEKVSCDQFKEFSELVFAQLNTIRCQQENMSQLLEKFSLDICELKLAEDERKKEIERQKRAKKRREAREAAQGEGECLAAAYPCFVPGRDGAIYRANPVKCLKRDCSKK
jgi:hypothetical protein